MEEGQDETKMMALKQRPLLISTMARPVHPDRDCSGKEKGERREKQQQPALRAAPYKQPGACFFVTFQILAPFFLHWLGLLLSVVNTANRIVDAKSPWL